MAVSLNGSRRGGRRHLICAVCQEVYRSPRLLPCYHSFCLMCIEGLARARGGRSFNCPSCRRPTAVPPAGAAAFQTNFHIDEEDLELAQRDPDTLCDVHPEYSLALFCVQCDQTICIMCKVTKHEQHETEELSTAAERCHDRLESAKDRLDSTISFLRKKAAESCDNLKAAREKGKLLEEQVNIQHDTLVTKVGRWRDSVLEEIKQSNTKVDRRLSTDAHKIQQELDSIVQLQQRVQHALADASDAEKVQVEKEMREGQGSVEKLDQAKNRVPEATARPGLHYDVHSVSDDDIRRFLGSPVELSLPCGPVSEVVVPIYQCGQEGACREVHNVCHVNDQQIWISFGGTLPDYATENHICMTNNGDYVHRLSTLQGYKGKRVTFVKFSEKKVMVRGCHKAFNFFLYAKNEVLIKCSQESPETTQLRKITITSNHPFKTKEIHLFNINSQHTVAFDATKDEQLFVVIEEKTTEQSQKAEYNVLLFHRNQSDPFTSYKPADKGFLPTDVCFWQEDGRHKLLVADAQNDSVHVVNVEGDACHFERYLAAGNGRLVRPTALNVDDRNRVWIGCGNGWILRCEKLTETDEPPCGKEVEASTSGGSSESSVADDYNRRSPGGSGPVPSTSWQASLASHASQHVFDFLSPSPVSSIRSPTSPTPSHASVSSVATELSIRSTDTLSMLSE